MSRVLVTGAGGFVGRELVRRLLAEPELESLVAVDQRLDTAQAPGLGDGRVVRLEGDSDAPMERHFGRYPVLETPAARALGFTGDSSLSTLVERATACAPVPAQ